MSVKDLAPALLAVGELFDAANTVLNEDAVKIEAHVKATSMGSFEVSLELVQSGLLNQVFSFFSGDKVTAVLQMKELIFGAGAASISSLFALVKWLRGKKASKTENSEDGTVKITNEDGATVEFPLQVLQLYETPKIRQAMHDLIAVPLGKSDIDEFQVRNGDIIESSVKKDEADYFDSSNIHESDVTTTVIEMRFNIVSLTFKERNKWRLSDGQREITAAIEDKDFLSRIENNEERFTKDDTLVCKVRVEQSMVLKKLKTSYAIETVLVHIVAAHQTKIDFKDD